jgi:Na+-transporting methylmalonyl-CoA/oxaloacetate decarboxylase gamma subunit
MSKKYVYTAILLAWLCGTLSAQSNKDLKINEVLLHNVMNYQDDFGQHNAWIEIFNSSYGTVDIGGCYLTDDAANLKKYPIPRGDVLTKIQPRQHVIFWADNHPTHGTFHLNFTLEKRYVALVANDGRTIIDSISLPMMAVDQSYGRSMDGGAGWTFFENTTPSTNNKLTLADASNEKFRVNDPYGIIMTITAIAVVFVALIFLFFSFKLIGRIMLMHHHRRAAPHVETAVDVKKKTASPNDVYAAIAFAMERYQQDLHKIEKAVLTINKVARAYSPWSSKIYGLREIPRKK